MPKRKEPEDTAQIKPAGAGFTKEQLFASEKFRDRKDLISALLADGRNYSIAEAEEEINNFMKGKVD